MYKRKIIDELGIDINALESPIDFKSTEWSRMLAFHWLSSKKVGIRHTVLLF